MLEVEQADVDLRLREVAEASADIVPEGPLPISFHNGMAVRSGFLTAIIVWLLIILPVGGMIGMAIKIFMLLGGGSLAVILYTRRTGEMLSVTAGARMGWITGVMFYSIWILFFTATLVVLQDQGGLLEAYKKQLQDSQAPAATIQQLSEIMQSPAVFGTLMVATLVIVFMIFTLSMTVGGALAAKAMERK